MMNWHHYFVREKKTAHILAYSLPTWLNLLRADDKITAIDLTDNWRERREKWFVLFQATLTNIILQISKKQRKPHNLLK